MINTVLVVGAGIMGAGIAQVAAQVTAQTSCRVYLLDSREGAAQQAKEKLRATLANLVSKEKISSQSATATLEAIIPIDSINSLGDQVSRIDLVVEAIIEDLAAKRSLFQELEAHVRADCILASNTSSISITAIGNGLKHPGRLVGMHFFNPVPLMKLVEVVTGLQTDANVAAAIAQLSRTWGKTPVSAKSTPGFIVNRIARPYYAEALSLLQEQAASPAVIDACLRGAGFRMGPCELIDLIGHDTNFAVTCSVFEANFYDKRYVPSLVQREMVDGGLLGRKSGRGFFDYAVDAIKPAVVPFVPTMIASDLGNLIVHGSGRIAERFASGLTNHHAIFEREMNCTWVGVSIDGSPVQLSDGATATATAGATATAALFAKQSPVKQCAMVDLPLNAQPNTVLAFAVSANCLPDWPEQVANLLALMDFNPQRIRDVPGLIVTRTIAMLINEAADAVHQGVCTNADADAAMKLGVNYPAGPFEWLATWDNQGVINVLNALDKHYRGERYRVSPWLLANQPSTNQDSL